MTDHYGSTISIEARLIEDDKNGQYLIFVEGWDEYRYVYYTSMHLRLREDGKIIVYQDNTDIILIDLLEKSGINVSDIIVAFHHPSMRKHTEFAEA